VDPLDFVLLVQTVLQSARFLSVPISWLHPTTPSPHWSIVSYLIVARLDLVLHLCKICQLELLFKPYCAILPSINSSPSFLSSNIMSKRICACGCKCLISESMEHHYQDSQEPRTLTLHVLSTNPWVKSLAKKNITKATAKKTLFGRPRKHSHQLWKSPTPPDVDIPMFTDIDEKPALAESANSGGDGDSDSHVLSTVQRSNTIPSKVAQVCQNCWRSGHRELIQEDTSSDKADVRATT